MVVEKTGCPALGNPHLNLDRERFDWKLFSENYKRQ